MRRTKIHRVTEGRDAGKFFLLTEMPAMATEKWAMRAFLALARSGVEVPDDIRSAGIAGMAAMGFQALNRLNYEDIEPLLDEMMQCVQICRDPQHKDVGSALLPDDIEDVSTILTLRAEVFALHVGFSWADALSKLRSASASPPKELSTTSTSPDQSGQSSPPGKPA